MSESEVLDAPQLPSPHRTKFECEREAFFRLLPSLLANPPGRYVAIHNGAVAASGDDKVAVTKKAFDRVGYVELYVGEVAARPRMGRLPTRRPMS